MPKTETQLQTIFDVLREDCQAAIPALATGTRIFFGRPREEQTTANLPFMVIDIGPIDGTGSADAGWGMKRNRYNVDVYFVRARPTDPTKILIIELAKDYDAIVERLEARKVLPGGGVLTNLDNVQYDDSHDDGETGFRFGYSVQFDSLAGT